MKNKALAKSLIRRLAPSKGKMRARLTRVITMKVIPTGLAFGLLSACAPAEQPTPGAEPNLVFLRKLPSGSLQTLRIMESGNFYYNVTPVGSTAHGQQREGAFEQGEMEKLRPMISKVMGMERAITSCKALHVALPMVSSDISKSDCFNNHNLTFRLTVMSVPDVCIDHPEELGHCAVEVQTLIGESQRLFDLVEGTTPQ